MYLMRSSYFSFFFSFYKSNATSTEGRFDIIIEIENPPRIQKDIPSMYLMRSSYFSFSFSFSLSLFINLTLHLQKDVLTLL
jgi:hypothetical protein